MCGYSSPCMYRACRKLEESVRSLEDGAFDDYEYLPWVLGTKFGYSASAASAVNYLDIQSL